MFGTKKRNSTPAEAPVTVDHESPHDEVAALEAELTAAQAAAKNGEEGHRDLAVIEAEMWAAQRAADLAADLNMGAAGNITRKEFEDFKVAVAGAFMGLKAALRDQMAKPHQVPELLSAHAAEMGISRTQAKALDDFLHMIDVVERYYGNWDLSTASAREHARHQAALRRPRLA
jgi:hypothetical protein